MARDDHWMGYQDLASFRVPPNFRGRPAWVVQTWWLVQATLFRLSPHSAYGWRRFILRLFGAKVGRDVHLRPTARVQYPWKVSVGDYSWVGDGAVLYSLGEIRIGAHSVVSQRAYLCAATHDHQKASFDLLASSIDIGREVWIAADVFIGPGVSVGDAAVVGARSSVFQDVPPGVVCFGQPVDPAKGTPRRADVGEARLD